MCGEVSGWDQWDGPKDLPGEYDFRYLEDPKNSQGNLDEPAKISAIVNEDLPDDDPVAYAFINNLRLNDEELVALENAQAKEGEDQGRPVVARGQPRRGSARDRRREEGAVAARPQS